MDFNAMLTSAATATKATKSANKRRDGGRFWALLTCRHIGPLWTEMVDHPELDPSAPIKFVVSTADMITTELLDAGKTVPADPVSGSGFANARARMVHWHNLSRGFGFGTASINAKTITVVFADAATVQRAIDNSCALLNGTTGDDLPWLKGKTVQTATTLQRRLEKREADAREAAVKPKAKRTPRKKASKK
jgi:hypothetical protein